MSNLSDTHMVQMLTDIFGAGIDRSRATLDWALYCLAGHPDVQTLVQEEVDLVTGSRMPSLSDRGSLPYTEATLHEVMRIGTVAPFGLPHQTIRATSVGGYNIPKETTVVVNFWALHNDLDQWDHPELFRPQRFLDSQGRLAPKPNSWLPFSAGRRVCLRGEAVAKPELLLVLACIVKRFRVSLEPGAVFDPTPQNKMVNGVPKPYKIVVTDRRQC
ncbi:hypothetical protein BaRGS_00018698 [Batillaria attramentaria]|uniref:Cytochrome P450 n=1 Tax=Batillaria attramentaria TaxID=370345 RepID=A0ABD0KRU6_9CAEN